MKTLGRPLLPLSEDDRYRWIIVLGGAFCLFAALGLGRFSLGMMLPGMGAALHLSYVKMGMLGTLNFCGYLAAVLACGMLSRILGLKKLILLALLLIACSMTLVGFAGNYYLIVLLYFLTGIGSALANIPMVALVAAWFDGAGRGKAIGLCVMGNGFGILLSGKFVPWFNGFAAGWRIGWVVSGLVVACVFLVCSLLLKNKQQDEAAALPRSGLAPKVRCRRTESLIFLHCGAIYFLYGFSYAVYITFFVTALVEDHGFSQQAAGRLWGGIGLLSLVSGPLFGFISDVWGRRLALFLVFLIQVVAYLLIAAPMFQLAIYLSATLFAIVAWSIPSIMAALVGDLAGSERTASVFGFITFLFGIGQISGPACGGFLAEKTGAFSDSFFLVAGCSAAAALLSVFLPGQKKISEKQRGQSDVKGV